MSESQGPTVPDVTSTTVLGTWPPLSCIHPVCINTHLTPRKTNINRVSLNSLPHGGQTFTQTLVCWQVVGVKGCEHLWVTTPTSSLFDTLFWILTFHRISAHPPLHKCCFQHTVFTNNKLPYHWTHILCNQNKLSFLLPFYMIYSYIFCPISLATLPEIS